MAKLCNVTELILKSDIKIGPVQFRKGQKVTTNPEGEGVKVTKEMILKLMNNG